MAEKYLANIDKMPFLKENKRLETFKKWPFGASSKCNPRAMAEAGWFAVENCGADDVAQCMICSKQLDGWEESDDPWQEHTSHCPECPFVVVHKNQGDWHFSDYLIFCREVTVLNVMKDSELNLARLDALFAVYEAKKLGKTVSKDA